MADLNETLIELQTRLAYQEDSLRQLDAVTIAQAAQIDRLELALRELSQRLDSALDGEPRNATGHEPPPHY